MKLFDQTGYKVDPCAAAGFLGVSNGLQPVLINRILEQKKQCTTVGQSS